MTQEKYEVSLDLDAQQFNNTLKSVQSTIADLKRTNETGIGTDELEGELQDLIKEFDRLQEVADGVSIGEYLVAEFKEGGEAARQAAEDLRDYTQRFEEMDRRLKAIQAGTTESGRKHTPQERDEQRAQQRRDREFQAERAHRERVNKAHATALREQEELENRAASRREKRREADAKKQAAEAKRQADEAQRAATAQGKAFESYQQNIDATAVRELRQAGPAALEAAKGTRAYQLALEENNREQEAFVANLSNARYALFDVTRVLTIAGGALVGAATAGVAASASFERSFADVERTSLGTRQEMEALRQGLTELSTAMPSSFGEIADVAALGAQMNIATEQLEGFSETVIQFASTTDVATEQAAEGLGRLSQLTDAPQSEIDRLAASIYDVGTNSVATEGQVLGIANQIAVSGNLAGFAAHEIIGLSGALASLGVQPEMARGSILRIFQNIQLAVEEGGEELQKFADVAGVSSEQFAAAWRDTPAQAFQTLVAGLGRVQEAGGNAATALQDLGVQSIRDQQVMLVLGQNADVLADTLGIASDAYAANTALTEGYGIVTDSLVEKLTMLWNTLKAIIADGFDPLVRMLKPIIDYMLSFAQSVHSLVSTNAVSWFISIASGIGAIVGGLALSAAAFTRFVASMFSIITGMQGITAALERNIHGQTRLAVALRETIAGLTGKTAAAGRATVATDQYTAATGRAAAGSTAAAAGARAFRRSLIAIPGFGLALFAIGEATAFLADQFGNASASVDTFASSGLAEAIRADTAAIEDISDAYSTFDVEVENSSNRLAPWARELQNSTGAQVGLNEETRDTTEAIKEQTMAIGEQSKAWAANELANNEDFQKFFKENADIMREAGIDLQDALEAALSDPGQGGRNFFQAYIDDAREARDQLNREIAALDPTDFDGLEEARARDEELRREMEVVRELRDQYGNLDDTISDAASSLELRAALAGALGIEMEQLGDITEDVTLKMENFADGLFDDVNAVANMQDALETLAGTLVEHGDNFDVYTEGGRANMSALESAVKQLADNAGDDAVAFGNGLAEIFAFVEGEAGILGDEVDFLRDNLLATFNNTYGLNLDTSDAQGSIHDFIAAAIAAIEHRNELERQAHALRQQTLTTGAGRSPHERSRALAHSSNHVPWDQTPEARQNREHIRSLQGLQTTLRDAGRAGATAGDRIRDGMNRAAGGARNAGRGAKKAAKEAAEELRTLADYANDLDSVWKRAFDIRFGVEIAQDNVADALQNMTDAAKDAEKALRDARQQVRDLRADLRTLAADRNTLEYHLSVAVEYGDDLRATELRAQLAENSAEAQSKSNELADAQEDVADAQDATTKSLSDNTKGARANRDQVQNLVQAYQAEIIALANSGASTDQLQRRTAQLRAEFVRQLTQMGFNRNEVNHYARAFDDLAVVINRVPRNITVRANTNPAQQALNEFVARNRNRNINMRANVSGLPKNVSGGTYRPSRMAVGSGGVTTPRVTTNRLTASLADLLQARVRGGKVNNLASGGAVYAAAGGVQGLHPGGPKGTDTIPAWLTPGEFVQRRKAVDHYGLPFMNALNNLQIPRYYAGGGGSGGAVVRGANSGGPQLVELMPHQMRQLADMVSVNVSLGDRLVASAANSTNVRDSRRGRN